MYVVVHDRSSSRRSHKLDRAQVLRLLLGTSFAKLPRAPILWIMLPTTTYTHRKSSPNPSNSLNNKF